MKNKICVRKGDNYNFILAKKLDEPKNVMIGGNEITIYFENLPYYYGTLYYAIRGLFRGINRLDLLANVPKELKLINPRNISEFSLSLYCEINDINMLCDNLIEL